VHARNLLDRALMVPRAEFRNYPAKRFATSRRFIGHCSFADREPEMEQTWGSVERINLMIFFSILTKHTPAFDEEFQILYPII
jgi:hypothetical protein